MELIILSLGLLCIVFWTYFSDLFGKPTRVIIATLFLGLAFCAIIVVLYLDSVTVSLILFLAVVVIFMDCRRVYNNYGRCSDTFRFYNMLIMKTSILVLCMCLISQYSTLELWRIGREGLTHSLFRGDIVVKLFYCLAMTGVVAIVDAFNQTKVYSGFTPTEDDIILTGYVVGYIGKNIMGRVRLVLEVDLDEYKKQATDEPEASPQGSDTEGFARYDGFGRRRREDRMPWGVRGASRHSIVRPTGKGRVVYFATAMRYDKEAYAANRTFLVNYSEQQQTLYVEDEIASNNHGFWVCASVGLFAFFTCLTYFVRNM